MPSRPLEDYALIGDLETAALVSLDGSIDWLCAPRFDSPACFASLLGGEENGFWRVAPAGFKSSKRAYREDTLVLETRMECDEGAVTVIDCMPVKIHDGLTRIVRLVRGERGSVPMRMELALRFDYGLTIPWVRHARFGITATSGNNAMQLETPVKLEGKDYRTVSEFTVKKGETVPFVLSYYDSLARPPRRSNAEKLCEDTEAWWLDWAKGCDCTGTWAEATKRSVITLKALTHLPSGGIIAAPTTSLPEWPGGERNWDYRFCWIRDATFTLYALITSGLNKEAEAWRDWLLRVAAGKPSQLQTIYGPSGERLLPEFEVPWLDGYAASRPVRIGNLASRQLQLDVYGEVMDVFHLSRRAGISETDDSWALQKALMDFLETGWRKVDNGIWEVRGRRRHFTHSKVMAWVALDRAVKACEDFGQDGPLDKWRNIREQIHSEVTKRAFDTERNSFVQFYGAKHLDASLLMMPLVGFLPHDDPRVEGTVAAIEKELIVDGYVRRYRPDPEIEGLPPDPEGAFLPCTFWLVDNYALCGRTKEAKKLFEDLLAVRNDVGLLSEEYDPRGKRLLGNFPQAFSHVSLVNTAHNLTKQEGASAPAEHRSRA
jgi:GH15 family glucan-1,4-alpha-glucosidase